MNILHPVSLEEALALKSQNPGSRYLGGGTAVLSLIGGLGEDAVLIDISKLLGKDIVKEGNGIRIGAGASLADIAASGAVPSYVSKSAGFQASLPLRLQSSVGGNVALSRFDSYMIPSLYAADARLSILSPSGRKEMGIDEYVLAENMDGIIESILLCSLEEGQAVRYSRSSHAHAALTAACSAGRYAYGIGGSGFAFGGMDSYKAIECRDDLAGSGEYKRYLASVVFKEG